MDTVNVRFLHPREEGRQLTLALPRDTSFAQLTELLYRESFVIWQKPGYQYIYRGHLCNMRHTLGDYIPQEAREMELRILDVPVILL